MELETFKQTNNSLVNLIQEGFLLLKKRDFSSLNLIAKEIIESYPKCFWGYTFKLISETEIDITKPIQNLSCHLNDSDIQEDVKARLYYKARMKYFKTSTKKYEAICSFYPDIPGEKRGEWLRSKTIYDQKVENLTILKEKYQYIKTNYLHDLEIYSISEQEVAIVHNLKIWGECIDFALESLEKYNQEVESFVRNDFKKTPNPGNKNSFIVYLIFICLSALLIASSVLRNIFFEYVEGYTHQHDLIITITSTTLLSVIFGMFIIRSKIFWKLHPVFVSFMILMAVIVGALNIVSTFTQNLLDMFLTFFMLGVGLIGLVVSIFKARYYLPRNTYRCGSYIGNYKALVANNFKVDFTYDWPLYLNGQELRCGEISEYIDPYIGK